MSGIAYLGPPIQHRDSLCLAFRKIGVELTQVYDYLSWPGRSDSPLQSSLAARGARVQAQFFGTNDERYLEETLRILDEAHITHVLAFWGTRPLADIKALKRRRPHLKFILNVLCHPIGLTPLTVKLQHLVMGSAMKSLDGLVVSSAYMQKYFEQNVPGTAKVPTLVLPPCWSEEYARKVPVEPSDARPNVVFLGRTDWSSGQPSDNVSVSLRTLMQQGIDVHYNRSPESETSEEHACPFDGMDIDKLTNFAARFDASLIVYELGNVQRRDRFDVTVPDRLITSVAAGIPVALPAEGYSACKEYLRQYGAVIEYRSMAHLAEQLRDRTMVEGLRKTAFEKAKEYRAEKLLPRLTSFLNELR
ncbi:hypothetical protein [Terriglobus saanensis]|uniref:Uncharacterized protein n=1 Tax=Terriglobus saanensis (strain ATCC BAA-1853 / DSM 23119 / SP1PR4) TaxID=401053 RepID=E8V166_TERSS|nr:hypothetical protein [Terriglobus saanensis]ADV83414.1 hypothetical protein AciPR4_2636 [Terriglobus saanensis SP1PR4]